MFPLPAQLALRTTRKADVGSGVGRVVALATCVLTAGGRRVLVAIDARACAVGCAVGSRLQEAGLKAISSQRMPAAVRAGVRITAFIFMQARVFVNAHLARDGHVDRREIGCYYLAVRKCVCQCDLCWEASLG
jgi:hypothetical protein